MERMRNVRAALRVGVACLLVIVCVTASGASEDKETNLFDLDRSKFSNPTKIDNKWWPLKPGMKIVYEGVEVDENGDPLLRCFVLIVTDLSKEIGGLPARVIFERDYAEGKLIEAELAFFAQDDEGNVWHLGQYVESYDEMEFLGGTMWAVGLPEKAKAGIMMWADPKPGEPSYSEGYAPAPFNWTDRGRVVEAGVTVETPAGTFNDVIIIEEYDEENPGAIQTKYYAPGVGNVKVGWKGEDAQKEELELIEISELNAEQMDKVRREALELETRASAYAKTSPARRLK